MSKFSESFGGVLQQRRDHITLSEEFRKRFPNLAEVFAGELSEDGAKVVRHPASITLFFEAGRFKFCISPAGESRIAFGSGQDGVGGFSEIEQALELGHFEWKFRSGQKRS